jgi:hypothetical protein
MKMNLFHMATTATTTTTRMESIRGPTGHVASSMSKAAQHGHCGRRQIPGLHWYLPTHALHAKFISLHRTRVLYARASRFQMSLQCGRVPGKRTIHFSHFAIQFLHRERAMSRRRVSYDLRGSRSSVPLAKTHSRIYSDLRVTFSRVSLSATLRWHDYDAHLVRRPSNLRPRPRPIISLYFPLEPIH